MGLGDITGIVDDIESALAAAADKVENPPQAQPNPTQSEVSGDPMKVFGPSFKSAFGDGFTNTRQKVYQQFSKNIRANEPPDPIQDWECRIGLTKLFVPPQNINVAKTFQSGSIFSGAIRQPNSPKFNSGHSETTVAMTLFFPNFQNVWGIPLDNGKNTTFDIDFDRDSYQVIDSFCSSLRGLVAQFKYSPFLPIKNVYLNTVHNITGVSLESMNLSTVPDYPYTIQVELHLLKFNFASYMPMVTDFNEAMHWGKFRQYIGRAMVRLNNLANQSFIDVTPSDLTDHIAAPGPLSTQDAAKFGQTAGYLSQPPNQPVIRDSVSNYLITDRSKSVDFFYPEQDPNSILSPNLAGIDLGGKNVGDSGNNESWWKEIADTIGLNLANPLEQYQSILQGLPAGQMKSELTLIQQYLDQLHVSVNSMSENKLQDFIAHVLSAPQYVNASNATQDQVRANLTSAWVVYIYDSYISNSGLSSALAVQSYLEGETLVKEWLVPMVRLNIDTDIVIISSVSINLTNNFARLTLNMVDDPVHQHIGGGDSTIEIGMWIIGEDALTKMRLMFETINGLGRLEHTHAVLGFMGIKNIITALAGVKFVVPLTFDVNTIPDYPHCYEVRLTFLDFDIFQQQREELGTEQQQEFIDHFSKRNPFLRIQQTWCVDAETEILTTNGWLKYDELTSGVDVLTLNHETGFSEWQPCLGVNVFDVDEEMLSIEGKVHSSLTTKTHRWPVKNKKRRTDNIRNTSKVLGEEREWKTSEDLNSNDNLITGALNSDIPSEHKYTDEFVEISAWLWTEGHMEYRHGRLTPRTDISQSHQVNQANVDRIRLALTKLYGPSVDSLGNGGFHRNPVPHWREKRVASSMTRFLLNAAAVEPFLSIMQDRVINCDFIRNLTVSQLQLFIDVSMLADQSRWDGVKGEISQSDKHRLEAIELASILLGHSTGLTYKIVKPTFKNQKKTTYHQYKLSIRERNTYRVPPKKRQIWKRYKGIVWCPITSNGSWLARRNGDTFYTGNSAFSAYPDLPLTVYDDDGKILGHLDPDYYFLGFKTIDDDIVNWRHNKSQLQTPEDTIASQAQASNQQVTGGTLPAQAQQMGFGVAVQQSLVGGAKSLSDYEIVHHIGTLNDTGVNNAIALHADGMDLLDDGQPFAKNVFFNEPHTGNVNVTPWLKGTSPPSVHKQPHVDGSGDPAATYDTMLADLQYRDMSGRMVRAFPTYMMWLIDEGGQFAGTKMYDNLYGLQSILDVSLVRSEDIMADVLVLKLSNLYGKLSAPYQGLLNPALYNFANVANTLTNQTRNTASGFSNTLVPLDYITLSPGVRIHFRIGFSADPNQLETVFNGVITQVEQGDIITVTAQSDAVELSTIINGKSKHGDTASIDGGGYWGMEGLWLSEPRDLMVRLLSMASSTFKEAILWATHGFLFSENKFGIRHFGSILYKPMTTAESNGTKARQDALASGTAGAEAQTRSGGFEGMMSGLLDYGILHLESSLWANFHAKRDYEIFMRNIYPGNGLGVSQYTGGDLGDGGLANAFLPTGLTDTGAVSPDPLTGNVVTDGGDPLQGQVQQIIQSQDGNSKSKASDKLTDHGVNVGQGHPIMHLLGIDRPVNNDVPAWASEVSFRGQTYMKTVWELFQLCAALLPNYVVCVRPWMDRSTIFYGKPHWLYTSGVIALTTGVASSDPGAPGLDDVDRGDLASVLKTEQAKQNELTPDQYYDQLNQRGLQLQLSYKHMDPQSSTQGGDPNSTPQSVPYSGGDVTNLPQKADSGATLPRKSGWINVEMHIPCDAASLKDLQHDVDHHLQSEEVKTFQNGAYAHPFYMDREGGARGGLVGLNPNPSPKSTVLIGDNADAPGNGTAFTNSSWTPEDEQYYMNMLWNTSDAPYPSAWQGRRIMVYCQATKKAVVCTPGDSGPASSTGRVAGVSPEAWFALGRPDTQSTCFFGFVPDSTRLGPVSLDAGNTSTSGLPSSDVTNSSTNQSTTSATQGSTATASPAAQGQSQANQSDTKNLTWFKTSPTTPDPETYSLTWGWRDKNLPVDFTYDAPASSQSSKLTGAVDEAGDVARSIYIDHGYSDNDANGIWNEFREFFEQDAKTKSVWKDIFKKDAGSDPNYPIVIQAFKEVMWKFPYNRGWLVLTTDRVQTFTDYTVQSLKEIESLDPLTHIPFLGSAMNMAESSVNDIVGAGASLISDAQSAVKSLFGGSSHSRTWDFSNAADAFKAALQDASGESFDINNPANASATPLAQWIINHAKAGVNRNQGGFFTQMITEVKDKTLGPIKQVLSFLGKAFSGTLTGVLNLFRFSIQSLTNAVDMSKYAGVQSNMLNAMYNDSVYYSQDLLQEAGPIAYLADNVFTREYGEPVIEIREPFQRIHFINSWQHIISDLIIENLDNINTVVTATSNGKHPVTVYFDKGAPSHLQVEKFVETGLYWDAPHGLSKVIHPNSQIRAWSKWLNNSEDETSAKRVALWHLKKSLEDIYRGEVIVLGDPMIRPYDICYMWDQFEKISGCFAVEQVVHTFNAESGFTTSITPNAIVTINDPGAWTAQSLVQKQLTVQGLRNSLRTSFRRGGFKSTSGSSQEVLNEIISQSEDQLKGSTQYTGGPTGLAKDLAGVGGIGGVVTVAGTGSTGGILGGSQAIAATGALGPINSSKIRMFNIGMSHATFFGGVVPLNPLSWAGWNVFKHLRDKVFDVHGCFPAGAQVLTDDGYKPIEDIVSGDRVFTHKNRYKPVIDTMVREVDEPIYELTLNKLQGTKLTPTKEHPFLIFKEHQVKKYHNGKFKSQNELDELEPQWVEARDLQVGDYAAQMGHTEHAPAGGIRRRNREFIRTKAYVAYRIDEISQIDFRGKVYNFSVDEDESYIVNNTISHNCYINYLNKYGAPMDAGLSYNHGVAVGQVHTFRLLGDALELPQPISEVGTGNATITLNDLFRQMGWQEKSTFEFFQDGLTAYENFVRMNILQESGQQSETDGLTPPQVYFVPVLDIVGPTQLKIDTAGTNLPSDIITLSFITTTDVSVGMNKTTSTGNKAFFDTMKANAVNYIRQAFAIESGADRPFHIAIRVDTNVPVNNPGDVMATVFYHTTNATTVSDRQNELIGSQINPGIANRWPVIQWDSLDSEGRPYTLNYELVISGNAMVSTTPTGLAPIADQVHVGNKLITPGGAGTLP